MSQITLWDRRCTIELVPAAIHDGTFLAEVVLTVPEGLSQHFTDREYPPLYMITKGQKRVPFSFDAQDERGRVTYSARFAWPLGPSSSISISMTGQTTTYATWTIDAKGQHELVYAQH